jgi:hypothetical protein
VLTAQIAQEYKRQQFANCHDETTIDHDYLPNYE